MCRKARTILSFVFNGLEQTYFFYIESVKCLRENKYNKNKHEIISFILKFCFSCCSQFCFFVLDRTSFFECGDLL